MRKILLFPLMMLLTLSVTACEGDSPESHNPDTGQPGSNDEEQGNGEGEDTPVGNGRYLVLFASRSGNTERMAQTISSTLDCDIVEIVPGTPYEDDYNSMLQRAQSEQSAIEQGNYPVIRTKVDNLGEYDMIFIGYPIWYGHMATPMQAFLHNHAEELKGKQIALFASSGSSGINTSVSEAHALVPDATFTETLLLTSSSLGQMSTRIASWLEQIGAERKNNNNNPENNSLMVNIKIGERTITATMEENVASRDFLSRLPLEVTLNDYNSTEKIYYPSPALEIDGAPRGGNLQLGDITIYAPWGNVAIFYKSFSGNNSLIKIGHINGSGIDALNVPGDVMVRFEQRTD